MGEKRKLLEDGVLEKGNVDRIQEQVGLVFDTSMNMTSFLIVGQRGKTLRVYRQVIGLKVEI